MPDRGMESGRGTQRSLQKSSSLTDYPAIAFPSVANGSVDYFRSLDGTWKNRERAIYNR
ncbi:hypothetical protein ACJ2PR_13580 [Phormidesmis sp. 146-33]